MLRLYAISSLYAILAAGRGDAPLTRERSAGISSRDSGLIYFRSRRHSRPFCFSCIRTERRETIETINVHSEIEQFAANKIPPGIDHRIPGGQEKQKCFFCSTYHASLCRFPSKQPPLILSDLLPMTPTPGNIHRIGRCMQTQEQRQAELKVVKNKLCRL